MIEEKKWYKSKGVWGGVLVGAAFVLQITGVADITPGEQATLVDAVINISTAVAQAAGTILAIYGRITAKTEIR